VRTFLLDFTILEGLKRRRRNSWLRKHYWGKVEADRQGFKQELHHSVSHRQGKLRKGASSSEEGH